MRKPWRYPPAYSWAEEQERMKRDMKIEKVQTILGIALFLIVVAFIILP